MRYRLYVRYRQMLQHVRRPVPFHQNLTFFHRSRVTPRCNLSINVSITEPSTQRWRVEIPSSFGLREATCPDCHEWFSIGSCLVNLDQRCRAHTRSQLQLQSADILSRLEGAEDVSSPPAPTPELPAVDSSPPLELPVESFARSTAGQRRRSKVEMQTGRHGWPRYFCNCKSRSRRG